MEQINPRGATNEIISQHSQPPDQETGLPEAPAYQAEATGQRPPLIFAEAETHNAFSLLTELRDHAMALRLHDKPPTFHLTELALSAAVMAWWSRWQPIAMHRAFVAGANLTEVAAAAGTSESEAYGRWETWAEQQARLLIGERPAVEPDEVAHIRERLRFVV